jgi:hypothetical protein
LDSKLYQLIWNPLLTNYTHELMTAKQNTDNRYLKCLTLEESKYKWKQQWTQWDHKFESKTVLNDHMEVHTGEHGGHRCNICSKLCRF